MKQHKKQILQIGVTGGIGSGKTAVCEIFARLGVPVLHSDDIAKELSTTRETVKKKLISILGTDAYLPDGTLHTSFIASKIFSETKLQRRIEALLHPLVEKERARRIIELCRQGHRLVLVEAALIYEAGIDKKLDAVIVVDAEESVRIARVRKRDAVTEEQVRARMEAQMDVKLKKDRAEYVILNNGTAEELESKVRFLYTLFESLVRKD